jgi:hypothetical protein
MHYLFLKHWNDCFLFCQIVYFHAMQFIVFYLFLFFPYDFITVIFRFFCYLESIYFIYWYYFNNFYEELVLLFSIVKYLVTLKNFGVPFNTSPTIYLLKLSPLFFNIHIT